MSTARWRAANPERLREYDRRWKKANPKKRREYYLANRRKICAQQRAYRIRKKYGLTVEEYDAIIARGCAICGACEGRIHLDHDHTTGKIRGALCGNCNRGIGHFSDDPKLVQRAADYLEHHAA